MLVRDLLLRLSQVPLGAEVMLWREHDGFEELAEVGYENYPELDGDEPVVVLFP